MTIKIQNYYIFLPENDLNVGARYIWPFLVDIILFTGILFLIIFFGLWYAKTNILELQSKILKICNTLFIVCILILVIQTPYLTGDVIFSFSTNYHASIFTHVNKIILLITASVIFTYLPKALFSRHYLNAAELPLLLFISVTLAIAIISTNNYALILLALEGFSLTLYILTTIDRTHGGIVAAAKYFTFGTLGSVLLFWGTVHIYSLVPSLSLKAVRFLFDIKYTSLLTGMDNSLEFAGSTIAIGLLIKLGAAPIHQWVADVYAGSHLVITAYFSTFVKYLLFILLLMLTLNFNNSSVTVIFAIASLIIGTFMTIRQIEIKRFLAYSSITHVGFLLIGDLISSYIYVLTYVCSSLLFFSVLLMLQLNNKELIYFSDVSQIKETGYWNPLLLVVSLISMAGLPPLSGFYGKYLIWLSLFEDIYLFNDVTTYYILLLSIVLSLIIIYYYTRVIIYIFVNDDYRMAQSSINIDNNINSINVARQQAILLFTIILWTFIQSIILTTTLDMWTNFLYQ